MKSAAEVAYGTREVMSKLQRKAFSAVITRAQVKKLSAAGSPTGVDAMVRDGVITWPPTSDNRGSSPGAATGSSSAVYDMICLYYLFSINNPIVLHVMMRCSDVI